MTRSRKWIAGTILTAALVAVALWSLRETTPGPAFEGSAGNPARSWPYPIDARERCWLRVQREHRRVIRVNCFAINNTLYTHSNRFAPVASLPGRSWTQAIARSPALDVLIEDRIYPMRAIRTASEDERVRILKARGYSYVPDGIQVYALVPRI